MKKEINNLIPDLLKQKRTAQEQLLTCYGQMVFRLVARIVERREDAEEVYQDVFVKAFRSIGTFDESQASLATWLGRIAYNESLNFVRKKKPMWGYIDEHNGDLEDVEDEIDAQQDEHNIERMEQALEQLPPHEQSLLTMFYFDHLSMKEIAYINFDTMNEKDMNTLLERDNILREAISRREQRQPSMPSDLNARLMQRMEQSDVKPKRRIWLYVVSGVAASILLLLTLHFWQKSKEIPQSVVGKQNQPKQTITVKKPEVVEQKTVAEVEEPKPVQQVVPQKKVVAKVAKRQEVVEEKEKVQELPAAPVEEELMAVVEEPVYDPMIEDPYAFVMNQMQDIRSRGERLQQEVALVMVTE